MEYTEFSKEIKEDWEKDLAKIERAPSGETAKRDTVYFARHLLGIDPYLWQYAFWKKIDERKKRVIVTTPRQVGKSLADSVFALKAAVFNTFPSGIDGKTNIGIISATDEQSKKLMGEIRRLIAVGDDYIYDKTKGKVKKFFSSKIDGSPQAANNKTAITFSNGNMIVCLPPTDRVRGYTFSYVFVDEAAFIEEESVFFECIEPTVSKTNGFIIMTSTPNGQQGFFFDLFDPDDKLETHEYERIWVHWSMINDPQHRGMIKDKKKFYYETGREKEFKQEYDALFTSQVSAFFESSDVDAGIDENLYPQQFSNEETYMGVDFGMVNSNTVISVVRKNKEVIELVYDYVYKPGEDVDIDLDISGLMNQYSSVKVIVDDCPQGDYIIKKLESRGVPLTKMSFRSEKVAKYTAFRAKLRQKMVNYYKNPGLIKQMKALQEIATPATTKIEKPSGGKDDMIDSLVIASYHLLDDETSFSSETTALNAIISEEKNNPRVDTQWTTLKARFDESVDEETKTWYGR